MNNFDDPQEVERRRKMMQKFVECKMRRRLRVVIEEPRKEEKDKRDLWKTESDTENYKREQLEYTIPYTDEYQTTQNEQPNSSETHNSPGTSASEIVIADENQSDCSSSTITEATTKTKTENKGDITSQIAFIRNRFITTTRKISDKARNTVNTVKAPPSCIEFDQTSTIITPTEVMTGDLDTNISVQEIKKKYFRNYKSNQDLPIFSHRRRIIDSINSYNVAVIEGATGCGKTTQVPTYILEDAILERSSDSCAPVIYVTQPRRIAARSIAERVCDEHNWDLGSIVGYQVGLDKRAGPDTILIFCTAGVLLQKIIQEKSLKKYTHIIIDEAHERDADTDLLMMMIRKLMLHEMAVFRLVIMSATMDIDKLMKYYTFKTNYGHRAATTPSYIRLESTQLDLDVKTIYLNKLPSMLGIDKPRPEFDLRQAELYESCLEAAVEIIIEVVPRLENYSDNSKSTLVFLPGLAEITKLDRMLRAVKGATNFLDIIPLHSCLTVDDQLRVFKPPRPGCRKVILATNIAESSITVTDVGFIVDFCLTKTLVKDTVTRFPTLKLQWSTQDKCTQRKGRTGRCCQGVVFRMVPDDFYKRFDLYAEPELLIAPLELSVLRVKNFQMGEIKALFAVVMDPPPFNEIRTAVLELKQMGALAATYNGQISDIDGDLTELGRIISALPIDVHLSKLIVIAAVFDVLQDAIIVAACLSTNRNVVQYSYGNQLDNYEIKLEWARGSQSDLFLSLEVYREYKEYMEKGKDNRWLVSWCAKNLLDVRKLQDVDAMVNEITKRLEEVNIFAYERPNQERDVNLDNLMLKVAFCAAFYPNYFLTSALDHEVVKKELNGNFDPARTTFVSGLPMSQVPIYKSQILEKVIDEEHDRCEFISDYSRAYLIFDEDDSSNSTVLQNINHAIEADRYEVVQKSRVVPMAVYRALKRGELSNGIEIHEYKDDVAIERMNFYYNQKRVFEEEVGRGRLIPACMKVCGADERVDNSHLIRVADDPDEYTKNYELKPYIEVKFDGERDSLDKEELLQLKRYDEAKNKGINSDSNPPVTHTFKSVTRRLKGPDSPIRMSFQSVLYKSKGFSVEVDSQSVNSILLDPEYKEARRQMLVSATVAQSKSGRVMARDTTLMPNIRGMPSIMALLFSQYYRLIYNNELDCFAGAVFGIGWTKNDEPLDRDYQVDLGFDVHITMDDIALINKSRELISKLLKFTEIQNAGKPQASLQEDLRKAILVLLRTRRYPLVELDTSMIDHPQEDNIFTKDAHNMPTDSLRDGEIRPFLPIAYHSRDIPEKLLYQRIRANLDRLKNINDNVEPMPRSGAQCLLCGNGIRFYFIICLNLENHLRSPRHIKKLEEFEAFEKDIHQRILS